MQELGVRRLWIIERLRRPTFCASVLVFALSSLPAEATDKRVLVVKLLEASGAYETLDVLVKPMATQVTEVLLARAKSRGKSVPDAFVTMLRQEFEHGFSGARHKFVQTVVPEYAERFTKPELEQLLSFYESPLGKKLSVHIPEITISSMQQGAEIGRQVAEDAARRAIRRWRQSQRERGRSTDVDWLADARR